MDDTTEGNESLEKMKKSKETRAKEGEESVSDSGFASDSGCGDHQRTALSL
jgi:hypothetical protein